MIDLITIFVIMVVVFLVLFWLKKTLFLFGFFFKLFLLFLLACVIASLIFGYSVIKDANDFKDNFGNSTSMVILKQTDVNTSTVTFLAGITFSPDKKDFKIMNKKELNSVHDLYEADNLSALSKDYYKIFFVERKSFDEIGLYNITDKNIELTKEEVKTVLLSDDARTELARITAKKTGNSVNDEIKGLAASNEEIKGYILSYYLTTVFDPNNVGELLSQLKNQNIEVYSNTALFKAIRFIPNGLIEVMMKIRK